MNSSFSPPFMYQDNEEIYEAVLRGFGDRNVIWPSRLSSEVIDLIQKLCHPDPYTRLGYSNMQEAREHKWFRGLEFKRLQRSNSVPQVTATF